MAEYKKEVSFAVTLAMLGVLAMAAATVYLFPSGAGGNANLPPHGVNTQTQTGSLGTTSTSTTSTGPVTVSTLMSTSGPAEWNPARVAVVVLNSPEIQSYIRTAYSWDIVRMGLSPDNQSSVVVTIDVVGNQSVAGNWTTGYVVSYTGIRTLNTTVQYTAPSTYRMGAVNVASLPDSNGSIAFSSQQQQVIGVMLSNSSLRSYMAGYGLSPYYVEAVTKFPIANGTYGGDFFAFIGQVNGPRLMGVFVNKGITSVVEAYEDSNATQTCYSTVECFTSPWNFTT